MAQQKDADVCPGSGIRADSALVDTRRTAFGKGHVDFCQPPGIASAGFLGRDSDCLRITLREFGDTRHAAWPWESAQPGRYGNSCFGVWPDSSWLVTDLTKGL